MSRPLRLELPDGLYHVTSRGDRCEPIFTDDRDRERLLQVLSHALARFDAVVHAYCLMGNHYHFVLRTRRANLSRLMRHVNGVYAQAYNRRHELVGHVFQGRFKAIHVDGDAYFMEVCRYVELNPVRAGLVDDPAGWRWSSYRAHLGLAPATDWLDSQTLHQYLLGRCLRSDEDMRHARALYVQLVRDGKEDRLWHRGLRQDIYLGGAAFVERMQERLKSDKEHVRDIPQIQRLRPAQAAMDSNEARVAREASILQAYMNGRPLSMIAADWNLSVATISRSIRKAEDAVGRGRQGRGQVLQRKT